ncbi:MAG: LLM class flavin-dependent oxidoreductase [Acidobacteria bacterium]|nr:LLM class flavin-dependent oxidoreductase [Acidobacteriota bacterium]MCA1610436.1 LLM class flavin-dependent oxidoreductase [Acidobacteriota bacterium]
MTDSTPVSSSALNHPVSLTLTDLLERRAGSRPEAIALAAPGRKPATYGDLAASVAAIAGRLKEAGVRRTDRVAVVIPNGPEMAASFLGVSVAAICAPLNPAYRQPEFDFFLDDLGARALILPEGVDSPARPAALARGIPILEISPELDAPAGRVRFAGPAQGASGGGGVSARPEDPALVLYTSGMTSRPKAVLLSQRELCTAAHNIAVALEIRPEDRCINVMPLFHAHGLIIATLSSLTAGASVVSTPGLRIPEFFDWVRTFQPTWYTAAPTIHQAIVENAGAHRGAPQDRLLRFIRSSAAFLPPSVKTGLEQEFGCPVIEAYGMTECVQITSNPLPPGRGRAGSVGVPAGPAVAIMNESGEKLPAGEAGEIVIQGLPVMQGYDRNPAANEASFTRGWFRTGDQGVLSEDGFLSLTGRLKEIINCGGEKLSPFEVDEALMGHPAVLQAVAFAVPHPTLGEDVAAAVVLRPGASASEAELRRFAAARLAEYKVPRQILIREEIPKGPTGKLRRIGLAQALGLAPPESGESPAEEKRPAEETVSVEAPLARIWCDLLKIEHAEPDGNFFRLGGDSIRASLLVARVRKDLRVELPLRALFDTPTFAEVCAAVERGRGKSPVRGPIARRSQPAPSPEPLASPRVERAAPPEAPARAAASKTPGPRGPDSPLQFSLFFFSADGSADSPEKYRLVLEASRFADQHGYAAVWTPERHFHSFGGLYPNPAVVGAAIAAVTSRIQIRAASVVLPLQDPIRVAEEWSVVDNLSGGRAGVSFASGWHVNDFALSPSTFGDRRNVMFERIGIVRELWAGRPITLPNGAGNPIEVMTYPRPVQRSLPIWLSCQSDATFEKAGEIGANVITSMFLMSVAELAPKIAVYREARARKGHDPATGQVTVSLHTFLAEHMETVREKVGGAYLDYLLVNLGLQADRVRGSGEEFAPTEEDRDFLTKQATERLFDERGLVGTVATCRDRVLALKAIGVDEITCLIDFGLDFESIMSSLYQLNKLKEITARQASPGPVVAR